MADYQNPKAGNAILDDLQEIVALINSGAKLDPTGNTNIPTGAKRVVAVSGGYQIQSYNGTTWVSVGKLMHDCDSVDGKSPNTDTAAGTIPVRDNKGQLPGDITGNAGTATKLATARTIDLGGIVSATEQEFDGSKPITIPVNSVNVNNDNDDAVVGVLTPKHGGTGRTDGAAADVVVSSAQGEVKASEYGQVGDAINKTGTDLDTLTVTGKYLFRGGTVEKHFPWNIPEASLMVVEVFRAGNHILQVLTYSDGQQWMRRSTTTGSDWLAWQCVKGRYNATVVTLYVSKSGSDDNTGLDSAYPVLTIDRAIEMAKGLAPNGTNTTVKLCVGEGSWGTTTLETYLFRVDIYPFDGAAATEYSSSLPVFDQISSVHSHVCVFGVVADTLYATYNGILSIAASYNRFAEVRADHGSCALFYGSTDNDLEIMAKSSHNYVLRAFDGSGLLFTGSRTFRVVENLTVSSFVSCDLGSNYYPPSTTTVVLADGVAVTGRKYGFQRISGTSLGKKALDAYPGSQAGTLENGTRLQTGLWGSGDEHVFLAADASWKRDSNSIYARDVAVNGNISDLASDRGQIGEAHRPGACDFNTLLKSGHYWFTNAEIEGSSNMPVEGTTGSLVVYNGGNGDYVNQLFFQYNSAQTWRRYKINSTWSNWAKFYDELTAPVFTGATSSAAGAKGLVPAPARGQKGSYFLNGAGNFMQVPYLRYTVSKGSYVDAVEYMTPDKSNRIACIRVSNEPSSDPGFYTLMLGVNDGDNSAPAGIAINRDIETGQVSIETAGGLKVSGNLSVTGNISGQNAFSTGDFVWSYASSKTGFLLCNGAAISRTTYADLYAIIGTKFGAGDGSTTFNLPDMRGRTAQGANGNLGTVLAAGLPNITGNVTLYTQVISAGGAFAQGSGGNRADGNYGTDHVRFDFNASRSSSIYGNSSTVQPPAIALNCFIKY